MILSNIFFFLAPLLGALHHLPQIEIKIKNKPLKVYVVSNLKDKKRGLMYEKALNEDEGMLFIYPHSQKVYFWMKNTYIPLSIGFFNADYQLIQIENMQPCYAKNPQKIYSSQEPVCFALEVNQGWFEKNGIQIKDTFQIKIPAL